MKKWIALLLAAAMGASALTGCKAEETETSTQEIPEPVGTVEELRIMLPEYAENYVVEEHEEEFARALKEAMALEGWTVETVSVKVAETDEAAGKALDDASAEVVIMPASRYFTYEEAAVLLMTATMPGLSVKSEVPGEWNGSVDAIHYTEEDCPYSRTLICTTTSSKGQEIARLAKDGTLTWEDLASAKWLMPKTQNSSDFLYPQMYLSKTFEKTPDDLSFFQTIDGYGALFADAASGAADVIVIGADRRIDYAAAWQLGTDEMDHTGKLGLGREDSIFNELQVIGMTEPIWGDVLTLRTDEDPFGDSGFQTALTNAFDSLKNNTAARELWASCGYTGFAPSGGSHYENIHDLTVYGAGD